MEVFIPIEIVNLCDIDHNMIQVRVSYDKKNSGPVLQLQAVSQEDGSFKMAIFGSPHKTVSLDSSWKTNNQKKLQAVQATVKGELTNKSGRAWDLVQEFAAANKFIIKG